MEVEEGERKVGVEVRRDTRSTSGGEESEGGVRGVRAVVRKKGGWEEGGKQERDERAGVQAKS